MGVKDRKKFWNKIFHLDISEDKTMAYLTMYDLSTIDISEEGVEDPVFYEETYNEEDVIEFLKENNIVYGVKKEKIKQAIKNNSFYVPIIVAEGIPCQKGRDGYFEFCFNTNPEVRPIILEDGSVDYNTLGKMELVAAEQCIAVYYHAVPGLKGISVYGDTLEPQKERDLSALQGKGFHMIANEQENTIEYFAQIEGRVEYKSEKLSVSPVLVIEGNVDATIGDINFNGDILIRGNVSAHPTIRATGHITVDGHVESAVLTAGKDILLRNGMQGAGKSYVYAKGDISAKFFEQAMIMSEGSVYANAIMNCEVEANESVIISGKWGVIIGGVTNAVEKIEAFNIGNRAGLLTCVNVGISDDFQENLIKLDDGIRMAKQQLNEVVTEYLELNNKVSKQPIEELIQKRNEKMRDKINYQAELNTLLKKKEELLDKEERSVDGYILTQKSIYMNTRIMINGASMLLEDECKNIILKKFHNEIHLYSNV